MKFAFNIATRAIKAGLSATWNRYLAEADVERKLHQSYQVHRTRYSGELKREIATHVTLSGGVSMDMDFEFVSHQRRSALLDVLEQRPEAVDKFLKDLVDNPNRFTSFVKTISARPNIVNKIKDDRIIDFLKNKDSSFGEMHKFSKIGELVSAFKGTVQFSEICKAVVSVLNSKLQQANGYHQVFNVIGELKNIALDEIVKPVLRDQVERMSQGLPSSQEGNVFELEGKVVNILNPAYFLYEIKNAKIDISDIFNPDQIRLIGRNLIEAEDYKTFIGMAKSLMEHDQDMIAHLEVTDVTKAILAADTDLKLTSSLCDKASNDNNLLKHAMASITRGHAIEIALAHPEIDRRTLVFLPPALQPPRAGLN